MGGLMTATQYEHAYAVREKMSLTADNALNNIDSRDERMFRESTSRIRRQESRDLDFEGRDISDNEKAAQPVSFGVGRDE
jgi:hypothetical protein